MGAVQHQQRGVEAGALATPSQQAATVQGEQAAGGLPSSLPATDSRRIEFDRSHTLSTRLMMLNIFGALVLLYWEARE